MELTPFKKVPLHHYFTFENNDVFESTTVWQKTSPQKIREMGSKTIIPYRKNESVYLIGDLETIIQNANL